MARKKKILHPLELIEGLLSWASDPRDCRMERLEISVEIGKPDLR